VITIHKAVLSGATLSEIRDQVEELARGPGGNAAAARLRDLAVELAAHRDLRVSVITYEDGTEELEVLHAGPPHLSENTIDCGKSADLARAAPDSTLCLAGESGIRDAVNLIRATLRNAGAP
jgi:hypothetical protein